MTSLQDILKKVPDPRSRQGLRHPHWALLSLIILSMPCGRRGMAAAHRLGKMLTPRQLRRLGFRPEHDPPSHPTLTEFTRYLDPDALAEALSALIPAGGGVDPEMARHVAIDGKTMRGTKDAGGRAVHVLSAFRPALEQCLGHESSRGKGMEIPDALNLIDRLDLQGMIVTGDAIFCRKSITSRIVGKGGDCVIPVKRNRRKLHAGIGAAFGGPPSPPGETG